jgi:hypothetical protein
VRSLASAPEFVTDKGWRPVLRGGWDLCRLWESLAALACAGDFAYAQRVPKGLGELEQA